MFVLGILSNLYFFKDMLSSCHSHAFAGRDIDKHLTKMFQEQKGITLSPMDARDMKHQLGFIAVDYEDV